ncbi:STAS domain-containing protein [Saccharothrix syringae]|uniref:STAS domain-containing protein n=1 Tax=Saccharothrix syringae TaxID=103733 RepID=A0A5Q0H135_SACSY|nr:STAS domain-containing protein [Saccharothrix syringae]QFZ19480.1 STAS domain-containing protein [Saccharothrix syringae]
MSAELTLSTATGPDGAPLLTASGEIDLSNADRFAEAVAAGVARGTPLTVDLVSVAYLDSAALNVLFNHAGHIRLVATRLLVPVLRVCGLTELVEVRQAEPAGE